MIHFFVKDNSDDRFYDMELLAWWEDEKVLYTDNSQFGSSFKRIEFLRLFSHKELNNSVAFKADFGKNTAVGHKARTVKEFIKSEKDNASWNGPGSKYVTEKEYIEFRKKLIEIYTSNMFLDLEILKPTIAQPIQELEKGAKVFFNNNNTKSEA